MTNEEKELLIKDISARLPYGLKIEEYNEEYGFNDSELSVVSMKYFADDEASAEGYWINRIENIKPYLRPMSSMTEEEKKEFQKYVFESNEIGDIVTLDASDWLNKKQFDYRGLIPKGLAIEASEGMYN